MVALTRVYHFTAAHQLANPALSPEGEEEADLQLRLREDVVSDVRCFI